MPDKALNPFILAQKSDSGLYECQISTTPVMSHVVHLSVTGTFSGLVLFKIYEDVSEPVTEILGGEDIYVQEGVTMNLTCLVRDSPEPPQFIFWYHNQKVLPVKDSQPLFIYSRKYLTTRPGVESAK